MKYLVKRLLAALLGGFLLAVIIQMCYTLLMSGFPLD